MDVEKRIRAREREAERRAKALERRIRAGEREADARRRAYENEMRDAHTLEGLLAEKRGLASGSTGG